MRKLSSVFIYSGIFLIISSVIFFLAIFYPVIILELKYRFLGPEKNVKVELKADAKGEGVIVPVDEEFGIIIPKIRANAKVIPDVNPYDSSEYQRALAKGVAHAKDTAFPGKTGNIFLFSHSSVDFYEASRYNSIFYLLNKLEEGDEIYLFYNGEKFKYSVTEKKTVGADAVSYLNPIRKNASQQLTLMTCWPPGTTYKRLLVIAMLSEN